VLKKWLGTIKPDIRVVSAERYETTMNAYLVPKLGSIPLAKLSPLDVANHYAYLRESGSKQGRPLHRATVRVVHRVLKAAIAWAVSMRLVAFNVCDNMRKMQNEPSESRFLELAEIEQLLNYLRLHAPEYYTPSIVAVGLGLRRGELLGLSWSDCDFAKNMLTVRRTRVRLAKSDVFSEPKTSKSRREIVMPAFVASALKEHRVEQNKARLLLGPRYNDSGVMFPSPQGQSWGVNAFGKGFVRIAKRAGLKGVTPHALRHSCATLLLGKGLPLPAVSAVLGHSNSSVTARCYAHALEQAKTDAADRMDDALGFTVGNSAAGQ
jgi:integrase